MIINKQQFINQYAELIKKEKEKNQTTTAKITKIKDNRITISTKKPINIPINTSVEVNRQKGKIITNNNKNATIKMEKTHYLTTNQTIKIKNTQKDILISKLQETLNNITQNKLNTHNKETLHLILETTEITFSKEEYKNKKLNKSQELSVKKSIEADKFHLIQGPPGTGKTHTITEIIKQLHQKEKTILVTTHTHIALDNILERIDFIKEEEILRNGQANNVKKELRKYTMEEQIKKHRLYPEIIKKEEEIEKLKQQNNPNNQEKLEQKNESILEKIVNKIFPTDHEEIIINRPIDHQDRINELKQEINHTKDIIKEELINNFTIIFSTVIASSGQTTQDIEFDYVIMDEASQVPVYLALIPLLKTEKFILIGDNKQLQPIQNNNSSYFLNKSIFNLLINKYPNNYTFLNTQYRMNQKISDIASSLYYDDKLLTGQQAKNKHITLKDVKYFIINEDPISFIDTSNVNYHESNVTSGCCNKFEAKLIISIIKALLHHEISSDEIGVITPYKKQKEYLIKQMKKEKINVETDTIYRFQGREKDVIILSFCKSSHNSLTKFQARFIADENQLNVSITRSRKKLIIIGNYSTLSKAKNIRNLVKLINPENIIYLEDLKEY